LTKSTEHVAAKYSALQQSGRAAYCFWWLMSVSVYLHNNWKK